MVISKVSQPRNPGSITVFWTAAPRRCPSRLVVDDRHHVVGHVEVLDSRREQKTARPKPDRLRYPNVVPSGAKAVGCAEGDLPLDKRVQRSQFADFLSAAFQPVAQAQFGFRQLSCRPISEGAAVANAYDTYIGATKDGKVQTIHGRTTLVLAKEHGSWKIVSAHFSPLPKE